MTPDSRAPHSSRSVDGAYGAVVVVNGQFFPTEKLTEGVAHEKLDQFVDDAFWSELVGRMAERDLRAKLSATKLSEELSDEEAEQLAEIEDTYWREFETSGVDHLVVLRGGKG